MKVRLQGELFCAKVFNNDDDWTNSHSIKKNKLRKIVHSVAYLA